MTKIRLILLVSLGILSTSVFSQKSSDIPRYLGNPVITDSLSTIFFPTRYNEELLSDNKIALWGSYYANMIVYNIKADTYHRLFPSDVYIAGFIYDDHFVHTSQPILKPRNVTSKWVFLLVKNNDYSDNGRIDRKDPFILFATSTKGENLKALTNNTENVVSFEIFEKQGFALVRIQRDSNKDGEFRDNDLDFYFRKIDLNDLAVGNAIELNQ